MIQFREMKQEEAEQIKDIDRSETINLIYEFHDQQLKEITAEHDCPTWDGNELVKFIKRFRNVLGNGGIAYGAFDNDLLIGFGVLGHQFRGKNKDQLQLDLMYVSKHFRRKGVGKRLMEELSKEAVSRGAKYLYISSTETESAVNFYKSCGSELTNELDEELFQLEPKDIHMVRRLDL